MMLAAAMDDMFITRGGDRNTCEPENGSTVSPKGQHTRDGV